MKFLSAIRSYPLSADPEDMPRESPRSEMVLWHVFDGFTAELSSPFSNDYSEMLANLDMTPPGTADWCDGSGDDWCEQVPLPTSMDRIVQAHRMNAAPMVTLGQSAPSYEILNLHVDHLGSTRVITNEQGVPESRHDFLPFGEEVLPVFSYNTKQFTGHERDKETGLDYMLARYYGANLTRFLSTDPAFEIHKSVHRPQRWNRYSYVLNNPLAFIDPTGEVLKVSGSASAKDKFKDTADSGLMGKEANVAADGTVTLDSTGEQGPPTEEQAALEDTLNEAISDPATTNLSLTEGSPGAIVGEFGTGEIDMNDVQALGTTPGVSATGALGHEVAEQFARQVGGAGSRSAHKTGIAAEDTINGSVRGRRKQSLLPNADRTVNGTITIPYKQDGTKTLSTLHVIRNDVVNVTERTK